MGNYFISYDLNGTTPTHKQMDEHIKKLGRCTHRVVETVWYVHSSGTKEAIYNYVNAKLSQNDSLIVIDANDAIFRNLLVSKETIQNCWRS